MTSEAETFAVALYPTSSVFDLQIYINRRISVDTNNFSIFFKGTFLHPVLVLQNIPNLGNESIVKTHFKKTEEAREQVKYYLRRIEIETLPFESLNKLLLQQELQFEAENVRDEDRFVHVPEPVGDTETSKLAKFIHKINPITPDSPSLKFRKRKAKKRGVEIENRLIAAYQVIPEFYNEELKLPFVRMKINGVVVKACIDTGASFSVMMRHVAELCGVLDLVDARFAKNIVGMGTTLCIGRVNKTRFEVGNLTCDFHISVVLTGATEVLLGLDFLKHFKINVNLYGNCLALPSGERVDFLSFDEVPERVQSSPLLDSLITMFGSN